MNSFSIYRGLNPLRATLIVGHSKFVPKSVAKQTFRFRTGLLRISSSQKSQQPKWPRRILTDTSRCVRVKRHCSLARSISEHCREWDRLTNGSSLRNLACVVSASSHKLRCRSYLDSLVARLEIIS